MIKEKWTKYAILIIKALYFNHCRTAKEISEETSIPLAYCNKVIASLRKANIIDDEYEFIMSVDDITLADIILLSGPHIESDSLSIKLFDTIIGKLTIPITKLF